MSNVFLNLQMPDIHVHRCDWKHHQRQSRRALIPLLPVHLLMLSPETLFVLGIWMTREVGEVMVHFEACEWVLGPIGLAAISDQLCRNVRVEELYMLSQSLYIQTLCSDDMPCIQSHSAASAIAIAFPHRLVTQVCGHRLHRMREGRRGRGIGRGGAPALRR